MFYPIYEMFNVQLVLETYYRRHPVPCVMEVIAARNPLGGNNPRGCQWATGDISS